MNWLDGVRTVFALLLVLGLIAGAAYGARRLGMLQGPAPGAKRRMNVVESLFLDARRRVVIVRVDEEDHVILLSAFGDKPLGVKPAIIAPQAETAP
jgi:flagellar protein FliO/FliZ